MSQTCLDGHHAADLFDQKTGSLGWRNNCARCELASVQARLSKYRQEIGQPLETERENERLRDELADYDNAMLRKFDARAAESTDLFTWITCTLAEMDRLRAENSVLLSELATAVGQLSALCERLGCENFSELADCVGTMLVENEALRRDAERDGEVVERLRAEVEELRSALLGLLNNSTRADWPDDLYDAAEKAAMAIARKRWT